MNNINEMIVQNFEDNIAYIQQYHPQLFEKLSALDTAVTNAHYQERYELVYEDGGFDVLEKSTGTYLYNKKISTHTKKSFKSVDFSVEHNCFEAFTRQEYTQERIDFYSKQKELNPLSYYGSYVIDIIHLSNQHPNKVLKSLDKFVFFGTGLGLHIEAIHKKINAKIYYIIEDDLELFRLSLFTMNYKNFSNDAELFFSVMDNDTEFAQTSEDFLKKSYYFNHYIKYFQLLSHSEDKANKFYLALSSQADLKFLFNDYLKIHTTPLENMTEGYRTLLNTLSFRQGPFSNKPFLLLASGPSLQNNISFLEQNHQKFITIAVSSSLKFLELHHIQPDIVLHLDPFDASIKSFDKLDSLSFLDNSLIFLAASSPKKLFSMLKKENVFIYEAGSNYKDDSLNISSPCVGSLGYMLLLVLKASEIYLLGLDLAVDSDTGLDHTSIHQDTKTFQLKESLNDNNSLTYKDDLFEIDGNLQDKVLTTPHFFTSVNIINNYLIKLKKPFQNVYNLSNGAYFLDTKALKVENIKTLKDIPTSTKAKLKSLVVSHATNGFNANDKKQIKEKILFAQTLTTQLEQYSCNTLNALTYVQDIFNMVSTDTQLKKYEIARVLDSYLYFILNFVYDYLNHQDRTLDDMKEMHALLKNQMISLINYYKESFAQIVKED